MGLEITLQSAQHCNTRPKGQHAGREGGQNILDKIQNYFNFKDKDSKN